MRGADYNNKIFKQLEDLQNKMEKQEKEFRTERKELKAEIVALKEENKALRSEVDRLNKIINNDSNNSSNPPSTDIKPNKKIVNSREKSGKKPGGQKGHKPYILCKKELEEKIASGEIKSKIIHHGKPSKKYKSKYIIDIEVRTVAIEHRFYEDEKGNISIPQEFVSDVQYGNELKTFCTTLNVEGCIPVKKLTQIISDLTDKKITLSTGSIVNFVHQCSTKSQGTIEKIKERILGAKRMNTDATVSRCESKNQSVRNYSTTEDTLLVGTETKSKEALEETNILNRYAGDLIHDHETVIYNYGKRHAECNVHILRYLKGNTENTKHEWSNDLISLLCEINNLRKDMIRNEKTNFSNQELEQYSNRYDKILEKGFKENKELESKYLKDDEKKLLNRLKKYKENHLLFMHDFSIPFDNNLSERELRHVKSKLKAAGCFRSSEGMKDYLDIKNIIITCGKKLMNYHEIIKNIYSNNPIEI